MDFVTDIAATDLAEMRFVAESGQFAIYAAGDDTFWLVQRHAGMPWTGLRLSGDGLFRISGLLSEATRVLYRELASKLSPGSREGDLAPSAAVR
jgi:hypothetical protein